LSEQTKSEAAPGLSLGARELRLERLNPGQGFLNLRKHLGPPMHTTI